MSDLEAQGRAEPVAIVDIGSNSVRLVAYEALSRAPTPTFNEKVLCGLGRGVATSGFLPEDGVAKALAALQRFRALCEIMGIRDVQALATAAVRDAANGQQFLDIAEKAIGAPIQLLSGAREARLAAMGVISSIWEPDGIVGDLGGGSLELTDVAPGTLGQGITLPLGGLSLMDVSERSPKKAQRIVRESLAKAGLLANLEGRAFYAVGGTWRALARLHMRQRQYPMHVMHNYVIPSRDALEFAKLVERIEADALSSIESVSSARRPLLAYGAAVLEEIIRLYEPSEIVISALGVREGLLYERLSASERAKDPLIEAASEFNNLRSRAPAHAEELFRWSSAFLASTHLDETAQEIRLRQAACLLSDVAWRAPSRLSRRTIPRHDRQRQSDRRRPWFARLSRPHDCVSPRFQQRGNRRGVALARLGAATRSRPHSRRGDARRLHSLGGDAGGVAAHADDRRARQSDADPAAGTRRTQQRQVAEPLETIFAPDRRRSGGARHRLTDAENGAIPPASERSFYRSRTICNFVFDRVDFSIFAGMGSR